MESTQKYRLDRGGRIDRSRVLSFKFNGKAMQGHEGDTIASALMANGIDTVNRSFKYHRPRGIMSAGIEETNALLTLDEGHGDIPVTRTTVRPLKSGMHIKSPNGWPSVTFDFGRILDFTHNFWAAGFYNKIFKWPNWHWYEGIVRRMAGLGHLPTGLDSNKYYSHNLHCDVMIVGAGPAGLAKALSAAGSGARILLVEQDSELGGSLLYHRTEINGVHSEDWLRDARAKLDEAANVTVMTSSTVSGCYDHNILTIADRSTPQVKRFWKVRSKETILATGAIEQPLVFENNDRPGIMLAAAAMKYVNRYGVRPARNMAIATNNDSTYETAFTLHDQGIHISAIIDVRQTITPEVLKKAKTRSIAIKLGSVVINTTGSKRLTGITIAALSSDGKSLKGGRETITCDGLAMSGGFNPASDLYSQAGGKLRYNDALACFVPDGCEQAITAIGAANGDFSTDQTSTYNLNPLRISPAGNSSRMWIDFMHDVTVADIELSVRENFVSVQHVKRHTTTGMSADQGKTSNLNALTLLAQLTDRTTREVGTTTFRPQYMPVPMGAIAGQKHGDFYHPARLLPSHDWHVAQAAVFENYGPWKRPEYYAAGGIDRKTAIEEEVVAVRTNAGILDGSSLGKIELKGPDAGEFLNRIYVNNVLSLKKGRVRYGIMLSENGIVIDDGVFARLSDDLYLVNTTSAGAERIAAWFEEWHQCEWPELDVLITPVTTQWGVTTVAGPNARTLLRAIESDIDFSNEAMPHMSITTGCLLGVPTRVQRVSYSGELSYEVSVPAKYNQAVIDALMSLPNGPIRPIGVEASLHLRTEKGFLHVGADTDGMTNALDIGFGAIIAKKKDDFVGKRSLLRPNDQRKDRRQFVAIEPINDSDKIQTGAHFIMKGGASIRSQGVVTSACYSPILKRTIGLGLLEGGFNRMGEIITVFDEGCSVDVRITNPAFYDPKGEKMHA